MKPIELVQTQETSPVNNGVEEISEQISEQMLQQSPVGDSPLTDDSQNLESDPGIGFLKKKYLSTESLKIEIPQEPLKRHKSNESLVENSPINESPLRAFAIKRVNIFILSF